MTLPLRPADAGTTETEPTDLQALAAEILSKQPTREQMFEAARAAAHAADNPSQPPANEEFTARMEALRQQKSAQVYGMAVRGEFPERLPLESVVALGCITLGSLLFNKCDADELRSRLQGMSDAGLLVADHEGLFDRTAVGAVLDRLKVADGSALRDWCKAGCNVSEADHKRGAGRKTAEVTRIINATNVILQAGGINWAEVPRAEYAKWLCLADKPLAGENEDTIRDTYLNRKRCADTACPTGRTGGELRDKAENLLNEAWIKGRAVDQSERQPPQVVPASGKSGR